MSKVISNIVMAVLLFLLCMLFLQPLFASTLTCAADNNKTYRADLKDNAHGMFTETIDWKKGSKAGTTQTIVVKDINNTDPSEDYLKFTDGKYTVTYSLRCVYE
jgi:hypothetical protein